MKPTTLPIDDERQMIGHVLYYRVPALDKRIAKGDDFAGDAWVRYTSVGHQPDEDQDSLAEANEALNAEAMRQCVRADQAEDDRRKLIEALRFAMKHTDNVFALANQHDREIEEYKRHSTLLRELGETE